MDAIKGQSSGPVNTARSKLRYPLRSATKPKEDKSTTADLSTSSASKRAKPASSVSRSSVSVFDLSDKNKSAKPTRRLSIPAKSAVSSLPKSTATITPISETRIKRSTNRQEKNETPVSNVSKSMNRRKFSVLSSASYWLLQIKLSESAAKHSISLGFFKLALESGCEPLQRLRDELKSYACRYKLVELGEPAKELLTSYNILEEDLEQLQASETCSQVPDKGTRSSDENIHSSSTSSVAATKLKPKSLKSGSVQASSVALSTKKESSQRVPANKNRGSLNRDSLKSKSQRPHRQEANKEKPKIKNQGKKSEVPMDPLHAEETQHEDKENMDAQQHDNSVAEVM